MCASLYIANDLGNALSNKPVDREAQDGIKSRPKPKKVPKISLTGTVQLWRNHLTGKWSSSLHLCSSHECRKYLYDISGSTAASALSIL